MAVLIGVTCQGAGLLVAHSIFEEVARNPTLPQKQVLPWHYYSCLLCPTSEAGHKELRSLPTRGSTAHFPCLIIGQRFRTQL